MSLTILFSLMHRNGSIVWYAELTGMERCSMNVMIGDRLRDLREYKKLSQGDIEKRTGLLRCYISRVENGHTVPSLETLEKLARALEIPMYQLFYDGLFFDGSQSKQAII